jgi:hypothetical protein
MKIRWLPNFPLQTKIQVFFGVVKKIWWLLGFPFSKKAKKSNDHLILLFLKEHENWVAT